MRVVGVQHWSNGLISQGKHARYVSSRKHSRATVHLRQSISPILSLPCKRLPLNLVFLPVTGNKDV